MIVNVVHVHVIYQVYCQEQMFFIANKRWDLVLYFVLNLPFKLALGYF